MFEVENAPWKENFPHRGRKTTARLKQLMILRSYLQLIILRKRSDQTPITKLNNKWAKSVRSLLEEQENIYGNDVYMSYSERTDILSAL